MAQHIDFLGVLAASPRLARAPNPKKSEVFGAVAALLAAGKGIAKGAQFLQSEKGQALVSDLLKKAGDDEGRYNTLFVRYRNKARRAKSPKDKAKYQAKATRYQERRELSRVRKIFASRGVGRSHPAEKGVIKETRRNELALEWDTADPSRKTAIESLVKGYDTELASLKKKADAQAKYGATKAKRRRGPKKLPFSPEQALVQGIGGLRFDVQSPPGPARLCRLPMYPVNNADSMSGNAGILSAGDDPTVMMLLSNTGPGGGPITGTTYELETRELEYGSYRVVGIQCSYRNEATVKDIAAGWAVQNSSILGLGVSLNSLQVYNGAELLLPDTNIDARSCILLRPEGATFSSAGGVAAPGRYFQQTKYTFDRRKGSLFMGLRDYPVVSTNAKLRMNLNAFAGFIPYNIGNTNSIVVPVCVNLVCEILTDKVFGNPRNPSPAGRAGALVKVAASPSAGVSEAPTYRVSSARWRPEE